MNLLCMLGWHRMELKQYVDKSNSTTQKIKYTQCTKCKEIWQ